MRKKLIILGCLIIGICLIKFFNVQNKKITKDYLLGVIQTNEYDNLSTITYLNDNLQTTGKYDISIENLELVKESKNETANIYIIANGDSDSLDNGQILCLNQNNNKIKKFDFNRVNITNCFVNEDYIYTLSNLNSVFYIDRLNIKTGEKETIEMTEYYIYDFVVAENKIYAVLENFSNGKLFLYSYSFETNHWECNSILSNVPLFSYIDIINCNNNIYIIANNEFWIFSNNKIQNHLTLDNTVPASQLYEYKNEIYIIFSDIYEGSKVSYLEKYNQLENKFENIFSYKGTILQLEICESNYYIDDYGVLNKCVMKENTLEIKDSIETNLKYDYCGGFFLNAK